MFEIFKLIWDLVVLRDAARKGQLTLRVWVLAVGFVLFIYLVGLPAALLYESHPEYKPLFIAAMVLVGASFIVVMWLGLRWRAQVSAARKSASSSTEPR